MNKKFLSAILFGALMVTSTGTFVSCKDYDDDIDAINSELVDIKSQLSSLQNQVNSGKYVTNVTKKGEGIVVTWNDGTTSTIETIKGDKGDKGETGATGAAGAKGEATVITIDPVTKNWVVDGVDTGICSQGKDGLNGQDGKDGVDGKDGKDGVDGKDGKDGKDAPIPTFTVGEDSHIYVQYGEDGEKLDLGTSTGGIYYVDNGLTYSLHICDAEGNWNDVVLPKTATITDLTPATIVGGVIKEAVVALNYGETIGDVDFKFNGKNYKNTTLLSAGSSLSAIINPLNADATLYTFALVDSKGNAPYVISNVKANATEGALSRAASVNKGVWDMSIAYASGVSFEATAIAARNAAAYALTTNTFNGVVASSYDVDVKETEITSITNVALNDDLAKPVGEAIDLINVFKNTTVVAEVNSEDVYDLTPYIVDYYFEIADKTIAAEYGIKLNGNILTATKPVSDVEIKVNYLLVNGDCVEETTTTAAAEVTVDFTYVAPSNTLGNVAWTINKTSEVVYLPLGNVQNALIGSTDFDLPTVESLGWAWAADGKALDSKEVKVNGIKYGKNQTAANKFANHEDSWIATIDETNLYVKNADGTYSAATANVTKIQTPLYIKFTFDYDYAFPGEYQVKLALNKGNNTTGNNNYEIPVKVTITAPATAAVTPFKRLDAYFVGNNAVAYGEADGSYATYDLFSLYKDMDGEEVNVEFSETNHEIANHTHTVWQVAAHASGIKVPVYDNAANADNRDNVYSTREFKAVYKVFGNVHIPYIIDTFNLTIKSAIKEGKFESTASKTIETSLPVKFYTTDFNGVDVFGDKFIIADTYEYDKNGNLVKANYRDDRIVSVVIEPADDNAEDYLTIGAAFGNEPGEKPAAEYFTVARKSGLTQLVNNTTCKIKVTITDKWNVKSEAVVTVVLKKF